MALTNNKNVLAWVDEMVALTKPGQGRMDRWFQRTAGCTDRRSYFSAGRQPG